MSIEDSLRGIDTELNRIAVALERIANAPVGTPIAPPTSVVAAAEAAVKASVIAESKTQRKADKPVTTAKSAETNTQSPAADAKQIPFSDIQAAVLKLVKAVGNAEAAKALTAFGAKNASTIPPERYAEFIALVDSKQAAIAA